MRRTVIWIALGVSMIVASADALAGTWSSLWSTPEQRAQKLLDSGQAQQAARLFKDPRRRAYAELKAGRYTEAVRLLKPLHDEQSQYNLGNALARTGDLPSALAAYDAALKQIPADRDARHNRDLVARELEQQAAQGSGKGGSQQKGSGKQNPNGQSQGSQSKGSNGQGQSGAQSESPGSSQSGSSPGTGGATAGQDSDQARQDAELGARLKRNAAQNGSRSPVGGTGTARGDDSSGADIAARGKPQDEASLPPPKSEQTLALEQWLRRIPDDPGGLLRRKFLIEHIERQQAAQAQGQGQDSDQ